MPHLRYHPKPRPTTCSRTQALELVARLTPEAAAALVAHWPELEPQLTRPAFTVAESLRLYADRIRRGELYAPTTKTKPGL